MARTERAAAGAPRHRALRRTERLAAPDEWRHGRQTLRKALWHQAEHAGDHGDLSGGYGAPLYDRDPAQARRGRIPGASGARGRALLHRHGHAAPPGRACAGAPWPAEAVPLCGQHAGGAPRQGRPGAHRPRRGSPGARRRPRREGLRIVHRFAARRIRSARRSRRNGLGTWACLLSRKRVGGDRRGCGGCHSMCAQGKNMPSRRMLRDGVFKIGAELHRLLGVADAPQTDQSMHNPRL